MKNKQIPVPARISCSSEAEATKKAKELAQYMGRGWKPEVWENMGWHYKAVYAGTIHVYTSCHKGYHCVIGVGGMLAMLAPDSEVTHHKDPKKAVEKTVREYKAKFDEFRYGQHRLIEDGLNAIGDPPGHFFIVVQEGGSTGEFYVHGFDTNKQAHSYRRKAARASYNTSMPIKVPDGTDMDALGNVATAIGDLL